MARKKRGKLAKVPKPSKSSKKSSRTLKHKKSNKSLWAVSIFAFFLFAFLLGVINVPHVQVIGNAITGNVPDSGGGGSAGTPQATQPVSTGNGFIADFFTNWNAGALDAQISKYIFWLILFMLFADIFGIVGIPQNGFLRFFFSLLISFLAIAFITPTQILVMLTGYSALGLMLGTVLPFLIVAFTSVALISVEKIKQMTVAKIMLEVLIWLFWSGFLVYKIIIQWKALGSITFLFDGAGIVMLVVTALSLIILILNKPFRNWVGGLELGLMRTKAKIQREARREEEAAGKAAAAGSWWKGNP